jgi:hypothetical protein
MSTVTAMTLAVGSGSAWADEAITGESLRIALSSPPQASTIPLVYEQNRELAVRYCATTLRAMKALKSDFSLFQAAVDEYVADRPPKNHGGSCSRSSRGVRSGPMTAASPITA